MVYDELMRQLDPEEQQLMALLIEHIAGLHEQRVALLTAYRSPVRIVVPEAFRAEVVAGAKFWGLPLERGPVEAPLMEA